MKGDTFVGFFQRGVFPNTADRRDPRPSDAEKVRLRKLYGKVRTPMGSALPPRKFAVVSGGKQQTAVNYFDAEVPIFH